MSARIATRIAVTLATAAAVVVAGLHLGSSLPSLGQISHPDLRWLTVAVGAEVASLLAYALLVGTLLAAGGAAARTRTLLRATVGGIAMMATLPAGAAISGAYWYRHLRRQGAERRLAALVLGTTTIAGLLSLTGILIVGVAAAGDAGPLASLRVPIIATALVLMTVRIALHRPLVRLANKAFRRFAPTAGAVSKFGQRSLLRVAALAYVNWLLDCASLVAALAAMHATVPAQSVLLTYALAQMVASLPLLPGGGGTVELSLLAGFAAFGNASSETIAGIILYRLISCWGLIPIGWLAVVLDRGGVTVCRPRAALGSPGHVERRVARGGRQHSWTGEELRHAA